MTQPTEYKQAGDGNSTGVMIGASASEKVGFYGTVPVIQRAYTASVHNTTAIASSTDFAAGQLAALHECMNTFTALGIWATA